MAPSLGPGADGGRAHYPVAYQRTPSRHYQAKHSCAAALWSNISCIWSDIDIYARVYALLLLLEAFPALDARFLLTTSCGRRVDETNVQFYSA